MDVSKFCRCLEFVQWKYVYSFYLIVLFFISFIQTFSLTGDWTRSWLVDKCLWSCRRFSIRPQFVREKFTLHFCNNGWNISGWISNRCLFILKIIALLWKPFRCNSSHMKEKKKTERPKNKLFPSRRRRRCRRHQEVDRPNTVYQRRPTAKKLEIKKVKIMCD